MVNDRTYRLKHPIKSLIADDETRTVTELTLRRPTGRDLLLLDEYQGRPMNLTLAMIERLAGLLPKDAQQLDAEDIGPLGDIAMAGIGNGPTTGENA